MYVAIAWVTEVWVSGNGLGVEQIAWAVGAQVKSWYLGSNASGLRHVGNKNVIKVGVGKLAPVM